VQEKRRPFTLFPKTRTWGPKEEKKVERTIRVKPSGGACEKNKWGTRKQKERDSKRRPFLPGRKRAGARGNGGGLLTRGWLSRKATQVSKKGAPLRGEVLMNGSAGRKGRQEAHKKVC